MCELLKCSQKVKELLKISTRIKNGDAAHLVERYIRQMAIQSPEQVSIRHEFYDQVMVHSFQVFVRSAQLCNRRFYASNRQMEIALQKACWLAYDFIEDIHFELDLASELEREEIKKKEENFQKYSPISEIDSGIQSQVSTSRESSSVPSSASVASPIQARSIAPRRKQIALPFLSARDFKWIRLISQFRSVFDPTKLRSQMNVMAKLIALEPKVFHISTTSTYNRHGETIYETRVKFNGTVFSGVAKSKSESERKAQDSIFRRLLDLSALFSHFSYAYYPAMSVDDFKLEFFTHNDTVLKWNLVRRFGYTITYCTSISLVHFRKIECISEMIEHSESIAIQKLIHYMGLIDKRFKSQETRN